MIFFDSTLIYPIFDVESIGDGPRVPRAHLEVVLTQLLAASAPTLYSYCVRDGALSVCQDPGHEPWSAVVGARLGEAQRSAS